MNTNKAVVLDDVVSVNKNNYLLTLSSFPHNIRVGTVIFLAKSLIFSGSCPYLSFTRSSITIKKNKIN